MIRKNGFSKSDPLLIGFLTVLLVLICLPRFDRRDLGLIGGLTTDGKAATEQLYDASYYVEYLELFRGIPAKTLKAPFSYRPLVPFLGSLLPFKPMTSINIVNLAFLFIGLVFLHLTLLFVGVSTKLKFFGDLLYVVSFPVFYYGTIGLVDPAAIGLLFLCLFLVLREKLILLVLALGLGIFAKETVVIIVPFFFGYLLLFKRISLASSLSKSIILAVYVFGLMLLIRAISPGTGEYLWKLSADKIAFNLSRPRTYLSIILSFGFLGLLLRCVIFSRELCPTKAWI
ncbi:MAG TPA: hypothetical protein P5224_01130 [Mesotoga sp.]|jgi:hypothetical protein|nr:hypothetical protein [Mesotoga sp.]